MEHKERNKGDRPKKEETEKLKYRVAVKMTTPDYFRLLAKAHETGISPSEYTMDIFLFGVLCYPWTDISHVVLIIN